MPEAQPAVLDLQFLGKPMGKLAFNSHDGAYALEFAPEFIKSGHDLSPLKLPIGEVRGILIFKAGDSPFTGGLPGLIADSLPDRWGERVLRVEAPTMTTVLGKLAAIGNRGPGAITFMPPFGAGDDTVTMREKLSVMTRDAEALLAAPVPLTREQVDEALLRASGTLGGAYPKTTAHLPIDSEFIELKEILVGGPTPPGHSPCILKFTTSGSDIGGAVEFAFMQMAKRAGIRVPRCCLVNDGNRRHFAVERFDRYVRPDGSTGRRHVHTLSGMLHLRASDGNIDYDDFIRLSRRLCGFEDAKECFRRGVFNILSTNRDDHGRNHAFIYDEVSRKWSIAPAYDLNPNIANTLIGLTWMGSARLPATMDELFKLAEVAGIERRIARDIYDQVENAVMVGWNEEAARAGVDPALIREYFSGITGIENQTKALRSDAARLAIPKGRNQEGGNSSPLPAESKSRPLVRS